MNEQIELISKRICELREILDIPKDEVAKRVGIPTEEYAKYENGKSDIPIGVLYGVASVLGVDPTVLLTGEDPKMDIYTVTRKNHGVKIKRYEGYEFLSLAANFVHREMEPMIVTLTPGIFPELVVHAGNEFNLVLEGKVCITIGGRKTILSEGDSIYFNPLIPHSQSAIDGTAKFLTVINDFEIK